MDITKKLESTRKKRGQSPEEACVALRISRYTWDNWMKGRTSPSAAQRELAEQYIRGER